MSEAFSILKIIFGIVAVIWGADLLTKGACALARRMKVSEMLIGLTIVAFGTSMPEFVISIVSALTGSADIAVGNIVGSNIFNTLCIVGITAIVCPITILRTTVRRDIPFSIGASILLLVLCMDSFGLNLEGSTLSRFDGIILLLFFAVFFYIVIRNGKTGESTEETDDNTPQVTALWKMILFIIIGLAMLIGGGEVMVSGAKSIAQALGISESVIGLTVVACGTSLPELATSVVAARKGSSELAIGNVLGSNVFNILWILGATSLISPLHIQGISVIDMGTMLLGVFLMWLFCFTKYKVQRWEGIVMFSIYLAYMIYLIHS